MPQSHSGKQDLTSQLHMRASSWTLELMGGTCSIVASDKDKDKEKGTYALSFSTCVVDMSSPHKIRRSKDPTMIDSSLVTVSMLLLLMLTRA